MQALQKTTRRRHRESASFVRPRKNSPLILVVEDEDLVREAAVQILSEAGYRVLQARTVHEALGHGARLLARVRLLFTDVVLPDQGGPELAVRLLELRPATKVIFTSGYPEKLKTLKTVKGSHYLQKPFSGENLKGFVSRVLRGEQASRRKTSTAAH